MTELELEEFGLKFRCKPDIWTEPVERYFDKFLCGGIIDPVAKWALNYLIKDSEIRQIMFLLDWLPSSQVEQKGSNTSVKQAVKYCQDHWINDPSVMYDPTLSLLMWAPWSRSLLAAGYCLPVNTLWGVRKFKEVDDRTWKHILFTARDTIMRPIMDWTGAKEIYACHANLRWLQETLPSNVTYLYHPAKTVEWLTKRLVPEEDLKTWRSPSK
jgi:hypothetical protein